MTRARPANQPNVVRLSLRFLPLVFRRWHGLLAVAATTVAGIGLGLLTPWPMKVLVDNVLDEKPLHPRVAAVFEALPGAATRDNLLLWTLGATILIFVLGWALGVASAYANVVFGQRLVYDLGARLFDHLQGLSLRFHAYHGAGSLIRRITTDAACISTIVNAAFLPAVTAVVSLVAMFLVMWQLDPFLTLLSLAVIPILLVAFRLYARPMADRSYEQNVVEGELYDTIEQTLSAIPVVQAFGREGDEDARLRRNTDAIMQATYRMLNVDFRFKILAGFATAAGTAGILWLGAHRALDGAVTVGTLLVFLAYLGSLYSPLQEVTFMGSTLQEAAGSAWRVTEVLDAEPEVRDRPGAPPLARVAGHVRIEDVTFAYEPGRPVLRNVTLEAHPGEVVALVGHTGAGKTTLASLVPRFFDPDEGHVTIDGHDLRDVQLKSVREQVSLVLQESFLFPITLAENIAYGRPHAGKDEIVRAARTANAHPFIQRLPHGYDTPVGERGATLSGGERQRIAIARALLKDAPILILDEPTSALDAETEKLLLQALDRLMAGRTTFIIAHRLSTIRNADRVFVVDAGELVEAGTHEELVERGGRYASFYRLQGAAPEPTEAR